MKTTTIQLVNKTEVGRKPMGEPVYEETFEDVDGVLVGSPTTEQLLATMELEGKKIVYMLGIPKGDDHDWTDREVIIWGERFITLGFPETAEPENVPLSWGKVVKVAHYG